jgi:group I intron endonuclease
MNDSYFSLMNKRHNFDWLKQILDLPSELGDLSNKELRKFLKSSCGVYQILCLENGRRYIGSTGCSSGLYLRWHIHLSDLKKGKGCNKPLQEDWDKYGADCFRFSILELCSKEELKEREQWWIDFYQDCRYNICPNSSSMEGYKHSLEAIEKIRLTHLGAKRSPEAVLKMRTAKLGRKRSPESVQKQIATRTAGNRYQLIHRETGQIITTSNLSQFCRDFGLPLSNVSAVLKGRKKSAQGWLRYIE